MRRLTQSVVAVLVAIALSAGVAQAQEEEGHAPIVWIGTVATNMFYMPVKAVHAAFGGLVGSLAFLVTGLNPEVSQKVFDHTLCAWWVTPDMLEGRQDLDFFGGD